MYWGLRVLCALGSKGSKGNWGLRVLGLRVLGVLGSKGFSFSNQTAKSLNEAERWQLGCRVTLMMSKHALLADD